MTSIKKSDITLFKMTIAMAARQGFLSLLAAFVLVAVMPTPGHAQDSQNRAKRPYLVPMSSSFVPEERVLSHREQAKLVRGWLETRFETVLPDIMRREGIDMWIIVSREYNDDPVFRSLVPFETYSSRRRTILVFHDRGEELGVEALSVGRFNYQNL
jgi:hypothetical protein